MLLLLAAAPALSPGEAAAQQDPIIASDTLPVSDTIPSEQPTPRNAFIRALVLPGWGHLYVGEPKRAAVFAVLQGTSIGMLVKSLSDLSTASDRRDSLNGLARDSVDALIAQDTALARELEDPDAYDRALLAYPGLDNARSLVSAREEHRQDWIVYTLVFTFASAVDAYVTAHMKDFPAELSAVPARDGSMRLGFTVPAGGRPPRGVAPLPAPAGPGR